MFAARSRTATGTRFATRPSIVALGLLLPIAMLPAAAFAAPAPPPPAPPGAYVVKDGDSLGGIARRLHVTIDDLLAANGLQLTSVIHPGDQLIVPGAAAPAVTAAAAPLVYVVVAGDSLFGVSRKLGVTLGALLASNGLTVTSVINPGQSLAVPDGGHLPEVAPATTTPAAGAASSTTPTHPYTVLTGDYLAGIARKNGVTLPALLAANNLQIASVIVPGMVLQLPPATLPLPGAAAGTAAGGAAPVDVVIAFLRAQVGKPYAFNTAGPDTYDCSGLVVAAFDQVGIDLPHQSLMQSTRGTAVDFRNQPLLPGDLVFQFSSSTPNVIGHVGIVIDASHWIQAAGSGVPVSIGWLPPVSKIQAVRRVLQG